MNNTDQSIDHCLRIIQEYYDISSDELKSKSRKQPLATYRHISMYILRKTGLSLAVVGQQFLRGHPTARHGINSINNRMRWEKSIREDIKKLSIRIGLRINNVS